MARQWRLRSKLLLGLSLVVVAIGLLVTGTVLGLTSYVGTMNTTDSKVAELLQVEKIVAAINALNSPHAKSGHPYNNPLSPLPRDEQTRAIDQLKKIHELFDKYREQFQDTVRRNRDPDPYQDTQLIKDAVKQLAELENAVRNKFAPELIASNEPSGADFSTDPKIAKAKDDLIAVFNQLHTEIARDMYQKIGEARVHYKQSMWVVGAALVVALVLMLTLMHLFKGWVFSPLRKLQAGVQRVFNGDFAHPIELKSGDELEELASALNQSNQKLYSTLQGLEHQVNERSRQLVRSERLASVGFLAAGVAHEINNPLASIAFCSEALQSRLTDYMQKNPKETEVIHKYLSMISQEAFRCKGITGKLLEFSRDGEHKREPADLSELVQGVLEIAQHLQNCRGKRIVFQPLERVVASVNGEDVKSVILNLVVNALDSMDEGGTLTITLQLHDGKAELLFADTGCGMTPEILRNIFEPFYTKSRSGKGTGLGLFISHQVIDQHSGEIFAASAGPNQGSTFTVRLPLKPSSDAGNPEGVIPFPAHPQKTGTANSPMENGLGHAAA